MNTFLLKHHISYKDNFWKHQICVSFFNICFVDIQVILKFLFLEKPNYVQTFSCRKTHFTCFCQFISIEIIHSKLAYFFISWLSFLYRLFIRGLNAAGNYRAKIDIFTARDLEILLSSEYSYINLVTTT
jgi:hypothetical protein